MADMFEAEALEEAERCNISGVNACDHGVLAGLLCLHDERFEQKRAHTLPANFGGDVHGALHGEAVAGPGAEVAITAKATDTRRRPRRG